MFSFVGCLNRAVTHPRHLLQVSIITANLPNPLTARPLTSPLTLLDRQPVAQSGIESRISYRCLPSGETPCHLESLISARATSQPHASP